MASAMLLLAVCIAVREAAMPIRVLVVDDDADFQWLIRLNLQLEHDTTVVGVAEDGETGVALALREQPDVIVMDLMMPRIDGFEATKRIKRVRPAVKVVVVTSFSVDNATRQEMYRSGVDALLGKRDVATALVPMIRSVAQS
jgi:two-component system, NarL family, response regulator